jgi:hypothetical protein
MVGGWREVNRKDAKTRRVLRILGLSVEIRDRYAKSFEDPRAREIGGFMGKWKRERNWIYSSITSVVTSTSSWKKAL